MVLKKLKIHVGTCPMDAQIQNMYVIDENAPATGEFRVATVGLDRGENEERGEWYNRGLNEAVDIICKQRNKELVELCERLYESRYDSMEKAMIIEKINNHIKRNYAEPTDNTKA